MKKSLYIFGTIFFLIIVVFLVVYYFFLDIKTYIIDTNYKTNINYVEKISTNLENNILKEINNSNIVKALYNNPQLKSHLEKELSLFITDRYKYIYVVEPTKEGFRFLLDGSKADKAMFLENYEPIELEEWQKVIKTKKSTYFEHKQIYTLWITYLKPIIINHEVKAILAIDFSMQEHSKIKSVLNRLDFILEILIYFFIMMFFIVMWFFYLDLKRQKELFEFNQTLELKVKEEIEKNRKKDEQLLYQNRLAQMGEMISMIAHQWRQPLSSINSIACLIMLKSKINKLDNELIINKMKSIEDYTNYLSTTINDFRDFFKPTKEKESLNYSQIIEAVLKIIKLPLQNKNIELVLDIRYNEPFEVFGNELQQVILNLIKNSEDVLIERKIESPKIEIRVYKKNKEIILEIEDNGGGIDENIKDKIFEPYFSTKDKNGTGLGLYMSKIIVEEHLGWQLTFIEKENGVIFQIKGKIDD